MKKRNFTSMEEVLNVPHIKVMMGTYDIMETSYRMARPYTCNPISVKRYITHAAKTLIESDEMSLDDAKAIIEQCLYHDENGVVYIPLGIHVYTCKHKYGKDMHYLGYSIGGKTIMMAALTWMYMSGESIPDGYDIDHIDNNPMNNDFSNLQCIPHSENIRKRTGHNNHYQIIKESMED